MSGKDEAAQLAQLTKWGIPPEVQAKAFQEFKWSPGKFIAKVNEMLDSGLASEAC